MINACADHSISFETEEHDSTPTCSAPASLPPSSLGAGADEGSTESMACELIRANHVRLVRRVQDIAAKRMQPRATSRELGEGIAVLIDCLGNELEVDPSSRRQARLSIAEVFSAAGLGLTQVIHGYVAVRSAVVDLAFESGIATTRIEVSELDACVAAAIARIEGFYARSRERAVAEDADERLGCLAHELRNRVSTAMLAFRLLESGSERSGAILQRSLESMIEHIERSCDDVRRHSQSLKYETIAIPELIDDIELIAAAEGRSRGIDVVAHVHSGAAVEVYGDRLVIEDALLNVVGNAIRHTKRDGRIQLDVLATADHLVIEVADECGGLPDHVAHDAFFERFEQHGDNPTGLGLGLTISRRGIAALGGAIRIRNLPGSGCVFAVELPRRASVRS